MDDLHYIEYGAKFSVHIEEIDAQHNKLFAIVNRVIDLFKKGSADYFPVLNDLVEYLSEHIHSENMAMMKMNYPGFSEHSKKHIQFIDKIHEFLQAYTQKDKDLARKIIVYLSHWVDSHTKSEDIKYGEYFLKTLEKKR